MQTLRTRLQIALSSRRTQLAIFSALAVLTLLLVGLQVAAQSKTTGTINTTQVQPLGLASDLRVEAQLSQTKWVQGQDGQMYLNLSLQTPDATERPTASSPTDMVVVLDRSPSMVAAHKLPYAKAAVLELLGRLDADDRLGLIGFDRRATVYSELVAVTPAARQHLTGLVQHMTVGSATNIGAGLTQARALLTQRPSHRVKKVILLSDGETNSGITDPNALTKIAADMSAQKVVLSAIGMGLEFNEALMAALADHGMGHYAYLEHVGTLGDILAQELNDTRLMYAEGSDLRLQLNSDIKLENAAGYPVELIDGEPSYLRIKTGQLLWANRKHVVLTLSTPMAAHGAFSVGHIAWHVSRDGVEQAVTVQANQLAYAVVEPENRQEAIASIRPDVYRKNWLQTNFGRMRQQVADWVKAGDQPKAQAVMSDYRRQVREAEAQSSLPIGDAKLDAAIEKVKAGLDDAFKGEANEQAVKRSRFSKQMQELSRKEQRQ